MVYISVLNWNGAVDTIACVSSLFKLTNKSFSIVICDNNSTDGSYEEIKLWLCENLPSDYNLCVGLSRELAESYREHKEGKNIYFIQTGANLGYAGGNNVGIRLAMQDPSMDYVWVLNNDTEVEPTALQALLDRASSDPNIAICGSKLIYAHDKKTVQAVGGGYNPWLATTRHLGENQPKEYVFSQTDIENQLDYIVGASMLISKNALMSAGLLSEQYFLYYEEVDYVCAVKSLGYKIAVALDSVVYHKEGASTDGGKSELADKFSIINRVKVTRKYFPQYLTTVKLSLLIVLFNRLKRRELNRIKYIFQALMT